MSAARLVIFDVDGTLVDSQADILASMQAAFGSEGLEPPGRSEILSIVGLSLPQAMARLAPDLGADAQTRMVEAYKARYFDLRRSGGTEMSPLYPGLRGVVEALHQEEATSLAIATGKSRRGLDALLEAHDLRRFFVTTHCADDHPSKPHPAMLEACLADADMQPISAVMIGDTSFDIDMARSAGMASVAVTWGYHRPEALAHATVLCDEADGLPGAIDRALSGAA